MSQSQWSPGQYQPPLLNTQHTYVCLQFFVSFSSPLQAQVLQGVLKNFKEKLKNARNIHPLRYIDLSCHKDRLKKTQ